MSARVLAAIVLAAVSLAGCTAQPAGKSCEQTLTCEAPEVLPKTVPAKCGCDLLFDEECRALIDRTYGKSAGSNLKTRLVLANAYGDAAQRACPPAPGQPAGKQKRSDAFAPSTVKPAKPIGEWW